jgi:hypothetical protein
MWPKSREWLLKKTPVFALKYHSQLGPDPATFGPPYFLGFIQTLHSRTGIVSKIVLLPLSSTSLPIAYVSGIQPGVRVPPGVREDILGDT